MKRQEFIRKCSALGLGAYLFPTLLTSCKEEIDFVENLQVNFSGKVLIIGAGAAGLAAGHLLNQYNIDFEILEASSVYGGRIKEIQGFVDFPIDLGGEWIHTNPSVLAELLNDPTVTDEIEIINYSPETLSVWKNDKLRQRNYFTNFYGEHKFKSTTWFSFFDNYIVPDIRARIVLNSPVDRIDYSGNRIQVTNTANQVFEADKVIVTIPVTMLNQNFINFNPSLPAAKINTLRSVGMPDGIKVFMEFSEHFYPDLTFDGGLSAVINDDNGEKVYYNGAFGKDSNRNVLALFAVGDLATEYTRLSDADLIEYILDELDTKFDGKARQHYIKHIIQNWSNEPFIQGSYTHNMTDEMQSILKAPVDSKLYFAGESFADDWATVHGAGLSGMSVSEVILQGG